MECMKLLLEHGANPNLAGKDGRLPLHRAAFKGHLAAVKVWYGIRRLASVHLCIWPFVHLAICALFEHLIIGAFEHLNNGVSGIWHTWTCASVHSGFSI